MGTLLAFLLGMRGFGGGFSACFFFAVAVGCDNNELVSAPAGLVPSRPTDTVIPVARARRPALMV